MGFGKEDQRDKLPFLSYQDYSLTAWYVTVHADFDHLTELVFSSSRYCKLILISSFHSVIFGRKSMINAWGVNIHLLEWWYLHELFGILLHGRFIYLSPLIYLIIYLYHYGLIDILYFEL